MAAMRFLVVCDFGVTMHNSCPTTRFTRVDLPTFGRPATATKPHRC